MNRWLQVFIAAAILLVPERAWAHAHLKRSNPAAGSRVSGVSAIRLWFSERPELTMTSVILTDSAGRPVMLGGPESAADDPLELVLSVPGVLPLGTYTISWRTAASDGHPSRGSFKFIVVASGPRASVTTDSVKVVPALPPAAAVTGTSSEMESSSLLPSLLRALSFTAILSLVGAVAFCVVVVPRAMTVDVVVRARMERRGALLGIGAGTVLIVTAIARFIVGSRMMAGLPPAHSPSVMDLATHSAWGAAMQLQIIAAVVVLAALAVTLQDIKDGWIVATIGVVIIAATPAFTGHAAATPEFTSFMIAADFLHVLGASAWLGTLLSVLVVGLPIALTLDFEDRWWSVSAMVNSFSSLALASVAVVAASGLFVSWMHLDHLSALWQSDYGRVLLIKLGLVMITLLVGAYNYKRVQPRLAGGHSGAQLRWSAGTELLFALLVLAVTGYLTGIEP